MGETITVFGDGRQTRDFTYVDDIVAARAAAGSADIAPGRAYNIRGGSQTSIRQALALIAELSARELDVVYTASERGDVRDTSANTTRARNELGFAPATGLEDGLAAELDWTRLTLGKPGEVRR
jgi:nucleoside-diphosphate-sugar epimerase